MFDRAQCEQEEEGQDQHKELPNREKNHSSDSLTVQ